MNDKYAIEEPVSVLDAPQTVETWHEQEKKEWHEQVTTPETAAVEEPLFDRETVAVEEPLVNPETVAVVEPPVNPKAVASVPVPWLKSEEVNDLQSRWNAIQIGFVDEPRKSVEQADELVVEALKRIEQAFTLQRTTLNERWLNNEDIQTEDLRISLQSYRSFLNRILAL